MQANEFRTRLSVADSKGSDNQASTALDMKKINLRIKQEQDPQLSVKNTTPMKPIDLGQQAQPRISVASSKNKFLTGSHKRTLSGVVADVNSLNAAKITNKEYAFADLLGDINYINDENEEQAEESKGEPVLTKKQLAQMKKEKEAMTTPVKETTQPSLPVKQASETKPQAKSRLSKYLIMGDGQDLAQSLSVNSKGEATSNKSPIDKAAATNKGSGNAQDTKSQPSSFDVLDANTLSSGSTNKNKEAGAKTLQVNLDDVEDTEEEKKSSDSFEKVELTESMITASEKSKSQQNIERYSAAFEAKLNDEIAKIS